MGLIWARLWLLALIALSSFPGSSLAIKLKFRYEECLTYEFTMYEPFYGSFVAMPDLYNMQAKYDLLITSPNEVRVHESTAQSEGKFNLVPYEAGRYKFCMKLNQDKSLSKYVLSRDIIWDLHVGKADAPDHIKETDTQTLWHYVYQVDAQLQQLKATQQYMFWREKRHRITLESTNGRVVFYAILRSSVLVLVYVVQVLFIRRMFSK
jgi:hypothetical protein